MDSITKVLDSMVSYYGSDIKRISHFLKVHGFTKLIAANENLDSAQQELLEITALTHDIGIKISEEKYNSSAGKYQEIEGPAEAEKMLTDLGIDEKIITRTCWLIAHHHTYDNIDSVDYQILVEADFLVNINEDNMSAASIKSIEKKIFKTASGLRLLHHLYPC
ncbi:HD domain-containing protein [Pectinatus brassicae]|uniref:HD superfamily phosphodiesterase n=1 Tax=Pectinatus brassicae TaxID=862415 RepID=A0A840UVZ7_9FIRM|nr:HD domain-containing protein [Pectinatus brassicae]MBB5337063.1 HD superfamily phosphodiesterase [Pectinatus brassicae]